MADNDHVLDDSLGPANSPTNGPLDPRVASTHLVFGEDAEIFKDGTTLRLRNYMLDGKRVRVSLCPDGRIEQHDTASHIAEISNLTIEITVNGMLFEIDQHAILSTPNDLIYAISGIEDQVQVLQALGQKLEGVDAIAMVHFKYFLNTGIVDTSKGRSVLHTGPAKDGYKLSVQIACLRLAVALKATRFLTHLVKEIEYVWICHDLDLSQVVALVQAAPYLDRLLVAWTFVTPAQNSVQKDCFIHSALTKFPHYRNLVRQHAAKYTGGPIMPSVYNFLLRIGYIPGTISMPPQPSLANTDAKIATVDLATPLSKIGGLEKESDGKQGKKLYPISEAENNGIYSSLFFVGTTPLLTIKAIRSANISEQSLPTQFNKANADEEIFHCTFGPLSFMSNLYICNFHPDSIRFRQHSVDESPKHVLPKPTSDLISKRFKLRIDNTSTTHGAQCRIRERDGVAVTCPKYRAVLDHLHGTGVYHDDRDRSHAGSVHFGGWVNDYFQPYQIQNHLQLRYIPDLSDLHTYNGRDLAARRCASDSYVYEIAPDMFHRGTMRELPRSGNESATQEGPHRGFAVEDSYMDGQSYQRYLRQVRRWQVGEYEVYWAPPLWDIGFFLIPVYRAYRAGDPVWSNEIRRLLGLNADNA